ncbi:MAG: RNA polymerase sigma-70 factor [Odoribacteraceae bacterium]|jgi:RNA polymerase sigma-70 factor (ECF subfamily)|nr:RNA polymerase sigma-70 factor [Odoribacteraceae bacterium]
MLDETTMFEKMRGGDDSALEFFMRQYMDLLYYRALAIVHDKMVAEDIVQEVFIRFWNKRKELPASPVVPAYLTHLVRNACLNHLEHDNVRRRHAENYRKQREQERDDPREWDAAEIEELRRRLDEFIQTLPEKCREVFLLACVEGARYQEVADRLHISVNTVKTQIKSAYSKLRKNFNGIDQELIIILLLSRYFS